LTELAGWWLGVVARPRVRATEIWHQSDGELDPDEPRGPPPDHPSRCVDAAFVHGSWAALFASEVGDIDRWAISTLLVLERPDRDEVYAAASVTERRLGLSVQGDRPIGRLACRRQRHARDTVARGAFATDDENSPGGPAASNCSTASTTFCEVVSARVASVLT